NRQATKKAKPAAHRSGAPGRGLRATCAERTRRGMNDLNQPGPKHKPPRFPAARAYIDTLHLYFPEWRPELAALQSRELTTWRYPAGAYNYVPDSWAQARIDCWGGEPPPLILCESRATAGVLERITAEYLCPITATGGQCAGHIVNEVVPLLINNERR